MKQDKPSPGQCIEESFITTEMGMGDVEGFMG